MAGSPLPESLMRAGLLLAITAAAPALAQPIAAPLTLSAANAGHAADCANRT